MIDDHKIANTISDLMIEFGDRLNASVALVKDNCKEDDFLNYRTSISEIMGMMLINVMNPIYKRHPDLKPKELE